MSDPVIASPGNPRVKAWLRLRDRRDRERAGSTLVDGLREVERALDSGAGFEAAIVGPAAERSPQGRALVSRLGSAGIPISAVSAAVEARLAFGDRTEGVIAVVRVPSLALDDVALPADPLVVVVEGVEKPGNLGAVLRSADGAGADAVIAADPRTDLYNPNTIRASLGTIFALQVAAAPSPAVLRWCLERGLRVIAARPDGQALHTEVDLGGPLAIALGSEAGGLTDTWREPGVIAVRLPMLGIADSLNVSVAAAVLLYEARRQRGVAHGPG